MKIKITGKELKITDAINDYAEKKMERIEKYFDNAEAEIIAKVEKNYQNTETVIGIENSSRNSIQYTLDGVIDFMNFK